MNEAGPEPTTSRTPRRQALADGIRRLVVAIRDGDEQTVQDAVVALAESRRLFAPLAMVVGAFVMLFDGMKLLLTNWRLTVVQVLPAMWIWLAMLDLKVHTLHGRGFVGWYGPGALALALAVTAITAASFYLNAVFAFAIGTPGPPDLGPAFNLARTHARVIFGWGLLVGVALAVAGVIAPRLGLGWFGLTMGIVVGVMMFCYVAIPSRLLGVNKDTAYSRRDKVAATAMGGALGAIICTPPYVIGRIGILMVGSKTLFIPGVVLLALGLTLQAGATGSVKAIKMSAKLAAGRPLDPIESADAKQGIPS